MKIKILFLFSLLYSFGKIESEEVVDFDSISLSTVDDTDPAVEDKKNTGSYLFKIENALEKEDRISLNIRIKDLMTSTSPYLRTHPVYIRCLQKIITNVQNNNEGYKVEISSAYKTHTDIGSSTKVQDVYAAAGTGAVLTVTDNNGALADGTLLAKAALTYCPTLFAGMRQYIGIVMQASSVHVHMTGSAESPRGTHFSVDGYTGQTTPAFNTWAKEQLNSALDPVSTPDCSTFTSLTSGSTYPPSLTTPEQAVGSADSDVNDQPDYRSRLVVYPGGNLDYSGTGELLMGPRMYEVIRKLQFLVRQNSDKLTIEKLFAAEVTSLHLEGRQALIKMSLDNSATKLELLAKLARCAGADFIKNQGDKILIAVKKQLTIQPKRVKFAQGELLRVSAPAALQDKLGADVDEDENPLFDGQFQREKAISELSQLKQYMSGTTRYLRIHPAIVQCYDNLLRHEKKWNKGVAVDIQIIQAFQTAEELYQQFDPNQDPRGDSFSTGEALLLNYGSGLDAHKYDKHRLVRNAIHLCGPVFDELSPNMAIAVGIYDEGVYLKISEDFLMWMGDSANPPDGMSQREYVTSLENLFDNAIIGRVVNPEDPVKACTNDDVPKRQSHDYKYEHPAPIVGKRKRRQASGNADESCKVERNTDFCTRSKKHRDIQISHLWEQFKLLHMPDEKYETKLRQALEGCFGICGTCLLGEVYEDKVEQCNNLLHWSNFNFMNEESDVTNFFHIQNFDTRTHACRGEGRHCLVNAPLYAILASSVYALYRPDPTKSIEEELYSATDNPSPVTELLYQMYAISANGSITVWVNDEEEVKFLRSPLKVAMLYNKNVTRVTVLVAKPDSVPDVGLALEAMIANWVSTGCPLYSRPIIAEYTVSPLPEGHVTKRNTKERDQFTFGEQLLLRRKYFEHHWAESVRR